MESTDSGITFTQFILSLGTTAAVHFGDLADPVTGETGEPDLIAAAQMIDLLALLQDKTRGNLDPAEAKLLDDLLYDLRMRFVQAQQQPFIRPLLRAHHISRHGHVAWRADDRVRLPDVPLRGSTRPTAPPFDPRRDG